MKLFEREAETLKSLDHPAIPRYLDFFEVETELGRGFALVQSYIEARSLRERVQFNRSFSENDLIDIAKQLLSILEYLHCRQPPVIHRDIKPSNILLSDRSGNSPGQVHLVDFGSVQTVQHGGTVTVVGTYGYMPPEQFGGRSLPVSDLYSVGATLIYLATGQDPADLPQKEMRIEFEPVATLSYPFTRWLQWLTQPNPAQRPTSAQQALQPLAQGLNDSLPIQRSCFPFAAGAHQFSSRLKLQKISSFFELIVPAGSVKLPKDPDKAGPWSCLGCFGHLFVSITLITYLGWGGVGITLCLSVIFSYIIAKWFPRRHLIRPSFYKLTLKRENHSFILDLLPSLPDKTITPPNQCLGRLNSLCAGHENVPMYCLGLYCENSSLHIQGSRSEIHWLCDEFNEWTGLEVKYRDYSPPSA